MTLQRALGLLLPFAWLGALHQLEYIWAAMAAANVIVGVIAFRAVWLHKQGLLVGEQT